VACMYLNRNWRSKFLTPYTCQFWAWILACRVYAMRAELGYCASGFELRGNGSTGTRSAARQASEAGRNVDAVSMWVCECHVSRVTGQLG